MKRAFVLLALSFGVIDAHAGSDPAQPAPSACLTHSIQAMVAHRGARADWPDNTLPAYEAAIQAGARAVEVDVRLTADHELVVMHDPMVDRTTSGHGRVRNLRLAQLRKFQIITAPQLKVPTLDEVLDLVDGRATVMLDLKEQGEPYWQRLASLLRNHPLRDDVVLGVRSLHESQRLRELLPTTRQLALTPSKKQVGDFLDAGVSIVRLWPKWLKQHPELIEQIQQQGAALYVPTRKNGPRRVRRLLCYQPNYIQTDDPVKLTATLEQLSLQDAATLNPE